MQLKLDDDLQVLIEFMQSRFSAQRLVSISDGLHTMARPLWGRYQSDVVVPIELIHDPIKPSTQSVAIE